MCEGFELALGGASGMERFEVLALGREQHVVAEAHGAVAEGLSEMGLARASRPGDQHGDLLVDVSAGGQFFERGPG